MICSKDFLERLLNDEAQFVDKSNINLPENASFWPRAYFGPVLPQIYATLYLMICVPSKVALIRLLFGYMFVCQSLCLTLVSSRD